MYAARRWATRNARSLEWLYRVSASIFHVFDPLLCRIGVRRLEKPFAAAEDWTKGFLFDCQMCGRCVLSATGMTCPTNCPKSVRNGPCGGVRPDGSCEVEPDMRCVWVEAWQGSNRMREQRPFQRPQPPRDYAIEGTSAWLRLAVENVARRRSQAESLAKAQDQDGAAAEAQEESA